MFDQYGISAFACGDGPVIAPVQDESARLRALAFRRLNIEGHSAIYDGQHFFELVDRLYIDCRCDAYAVVVVTTKAIGAAFALIRLYSSQAGFDELGDAFSLIRVLPGHQMTSI